MIAILQNIGSAQFSLEDMTAFKVMFTAIITAMVSVYTLTSIGIIQLSHLYVSSTFVFPQMAGGILFGIGFVMGGYLPGTSCVSASTGRRDAFVFIGGMIAGIFFWRDVSLRRNFYFSTSLGATASAVVESSTRSFCCWNCCSCHRGVAERVEKRFSKRIMQQLRRN